MKHKTLSKLALTTLLLSAAPLMAYGIATDEGAPDAAKIANEKRDGAAEQWAEAQRLEGEMGRFGERLQAAVQSYERGLTDAAVGQLGDAGTTLHLLAEQAESQEVTQALERTVRDLDSLAVGIRDNKITTAEQLRGDARQVYDRLVAALADAERSATAGPDGFAADAAQ